MSATLKHGYSADERSAVVRERTKAFPKNTELDVADLRDQEHRRDDAGNGRQNGRRGADAPGDHATAPFVRSYRARVTIRSPTIRACFLDLEYRDYSTPMSESLTRRLIQRHRRRSVIRGGISEPVTLISYYLDRGTPEPIRSATDGARWNQAFEVAGHRNAFRVEMMPEGGSARSPPQRHPVGTDRRAAGYGSSITDPRTGEIIKGHVSLGSLRAQQDYLIGEALTSPYVNGTEQPQALTDMVVARLKQLAAHEVGHTIGLGHNYYDSKMGRISVMDYPHPLVNLKSDGTMDLSSAYAAGIGEWDKVAIRYGYGEYPAATVPPRAATFSGIRTDLRYLTNQDIDYTPR
jgi:hypothetical protein